jgi:hypothetical protein
VALSAAEVLDVLIASVVELVVWLVADEVLDDEAVAEPVVVEWG